MGYKSHTVEYSPSFVFYVKQPSVYTFILISLPLVWTQSSPVCSQIIALTLLLQNYHKNEKMGTKVTLLSIPPFGFYLKFPSVC